MSKIAFVFPGQGSQVIGMGKEIHDNYSVARETYQKADQILGRSISDLCFNGPEADLKDTRNCQPAILTTSIALLKALISEGIQPHFVAGHSLGEYSALVAAQAITFEEALRLVNKRAQLMAGADPEQRGTMAAILGLDREKLQDCLLKVNQVEAANYNCPGQIVVSGAKDEISKLQEYITEKGGKFIPLTVSGAFHSGFMKKAAEAFKNDLNLVSWQKPAISLISNVTALPVTQDELAQNLYCQIYSSVLWEDSIQYLIQQDVQTFVEVGPGKVLSGLIKKTNRNVNILNCEDLSSLKKALAILKEV